MGSGAADVCQAASEQSGDGGSIPERTRLSEAQKVSLKAVIVNVITLPTRPYGLGV
jgi:hypothetical protein